MRDPKVLSITNPLSHYCYLRHEGYRPRMAAICVFLRFTKDSAEFQERVNRLPGNARKFPNGERITE